MIDWRSEWRKLAGTTAVFLAFLWLPLGRGRLDGAITEALLLSGPSLPLPSMLVIRGAIGTQKTVVYVTLAIVMSTIAGIFYGAVWG